MATEVMVALFALAGTLIGSFAGVWQSNRLMAYRVAQLEAKVDEHNNLVERMAAAEHDLKTAFLLINEKKEAQ